MTSTIKVSVKAFAAAAALLMSVGLLAACSSSPTAPTVVGTWHVKYGAPAVVSIESTGTDAYTMTGKTPVTVTGGVTVTFAEYGSSVLAFIKDRACGVLMATSVFRSATQAALMTFLPIFLAHEMGYSPFAVGASLFALPSAMAANSTV